VSPANDCICNRRAGPRKSCAQQPRLSKMSATASQGLVWRNNPFSRNSLSPSPAPPSADGRSKSAIITSPLGTSNTGHSRTQSFSPLGSTLVPSRATRQRSSSNRSSMSASNTFAPQFIKIEELQRGKNEIRQIEGENDFSGKRYVWLRDPEVAFVRGWVVEDHDDGQLLVQCDDGSVRLFYERLDCKANPLLFCSNERWMPMALTRSIPRNLTRQMIWQSLRT